MIYKYNCDCCDQLYIGSSKLQFFIRRAQHIGISHRTGRHLNSLANSSIRDHSLKNNHPIKTQNFSVIDSCRNLNDLRILESIYINQIKPKLNEMDSATQLFVIK